MKILYAARMSRPDLLRAVSHLACFVTKWDEQCDLRLNRVVSYIQQTLHLRQIDGLVINSVIYFHTCSLTQTYADARQLSGQRAAVI